MASPVWSTACPDWERRIVAGESLIPCKPLFQEEADVGLDYFKALRAVDVGDGSLTLGDISRPWLLDFVAAVFGAYDPESGRRLIREFFMLISKKNGKSTDAAGIMLTALLLNWRQSGEMGILAPTLEVANNAWKPARDAIKADEELSDLLQVQDHVRTITHRQTNSTLQVVAADSETVAGKKWIVTLIDELWLFGKKANAHNMLIEATGGLASRPEGFVMYLSTQSDEPPSGVFKEKLDYARAVRDGEIVDTEFLPVLYEFPRAMLESKAYLDDANYYITNPNLGASVDAAFIKRKIKEAQQGSGASLQSILAKHLNVQIGNALRADRWAGADFWGERCDPTLTLDALLRRSDIAVIGIDGGGLDDMLGLCVLGRDADTGVWLWWGRAWVHRIVPEDRRKSEAARFYDFAADGDLVIVENDSADDIEQVAQIVRQVRDSGLLPEQNAIGVDPVGIGAIVDALQDDACGITPEQIIGISQGWRLTGAIKTAERKLATRQLVHSGQPLLAWCVSNCKAEPKGNATLITKQASGFAKIDPIMAGFNAVSLMSAAPSQNVIGDDYKLTVV